MKKYLLTGLFLFSSNLAFGEDIDLYLGDSSVQTGPKPQVLIIFDNSGSMNTLEDVPADYVNDPDNPYPAVGGLNAFSERFIYFTKGGVDNAALPIPDSPSEARRFLDEINGCQTAREILDEQGFYTGYIREYAFSGNTGSWQEIPDNNGANIEVIDCQDDVLNNKPENAIGPDGNLPDGYPANGLGEKKAPVYHTTDASDSDVNWSGQVVTLYTDNYLRYAASEDIATQSKSRLDVAKDAVTKLIRSAPFAEFGLQIFNYDYPGEFNRDGGRVVFGIQDMDADARANLIDIIDIEIDGETNTPLCETLYEASLYFGGKAVGFGDDDSNYGPNGYKGNTPPRDTTIEESSVYKTPFVCNDKINVILITDGKPTEDLAADTAIKALEGVGSPYSVDGVDSYLAELAGWMNNNDINDSKDGKQTATIFTIGFGKDAINDAGELLRLTATKGGGEYFPADDASALANALQSAISAIGDQSSSLTSASVASNNFDRTETLDSVYYAMFTPEKGARWAGNLKKYRIDGDTQYDANDKVAVTNEGIFDDNAQSFWSSAVDGNKVEEGGVAEMLRKKTSRNIYSNIGSGGALKDLTKEELVKAEAYGSDAALATELDVAEDEIEAYINWARGIDVDDEDADTLTTDMRKDVFGDPLHSKPLVINYGGDSEANQEIRIILGTNAGVLHMFDDNGSSVDEAWAFMPKEFLSDVKALRENFSYSSKVYGVDGPVTSLVNDTDGDGKIEPSDGDTVWIFFGLRRGGDSYYALDITNKDAPKLLWHIDSSSDGFSGLGQSWSVPKVGYSALNVVDNVPKPVLFIGAGYDINKDASGVGDDDSKGIGAYMIDAATGKLLWTLSTAANSATNTNFTGTDSVPAPVGILDSDSNGLVDRLYLSDTGGNVWRVDMPGASPNSTTKPWTAFKLASIGGDTDANDRRFFYVPDIARALITDTVVIESKDEDGNITETITQQERPYEAILLSSGDRSTPLASDTDDALFMFKDENVITQSFSSSLSPANPPPDTIVHKSSSESDLYDYTDNPFGNVSAADLVDLQIKVSQKSGWFIDLVKDGEKGTSAALVINGVAYFTTYVPPSEVVFDEDTCTLEIIGGGFLYAVDLALGTAKHHWTDEQANRTDGQGRIRFIGNEFLDSPTLVVNAEDNAAASDATTGKIVAGKIAIGTTLKITTTRTSIYLQETDQ